MATSASQWLLPLCMYRTFPVYMYINPKDFFLNLRYGNVMVTCRLPLFPFFFSFSFPVHLSSYNSRFSYSYYPFSHDSSKTFHFFPLVSTFLLHWQHFKIDRIGTFVSPHLVIKFGFLSLCCWFARWLH